MILMPWLNPYNAQGPLVLGSWGIMTEAEGSAAVSPQMLRMLRAWSPLSWRSGPWHRW